MSEIKREDLISDDALKAPLILAQNFETLLTTVDKMLSRFKEYEGALGKSTSASTVKKQTEELSREQVELNKVQNQIATLVAKNTEEYRKQEKELAKLKQEIKDKTKLGDLDSLSVNRQNSSIVQLRAALNKNRAAYAELRTEEQRASQEGKKLLAIIQGQDKDVKELASSYGVFTDNVGNYTDAMKQLKAEFKEATGEMLVMAEKFGEGSEEFKQASLKAGELKDKIGDLNEAASSVSGEPIERMGGSFDLIVGKLKALDFKGATAGLNQFTTASKELTFKQATQGIGQFIKGLVQMGRALLRNPLFILVAVILGVVTAVVMLKDKIKPLKLVFDLLGNGIDWVVQRLKDFSDWLGLSSFALDEAADKLIEAKKKEMDAVEKRYDWEIKLASAAGKQTFDLEKRKQESVISSTNMILNALNEKIQRQTELNDEEKELLEDMKEAQKDAQNELKLIAILQAKFEADQRRQRIEDEKKFQEEIAKMAVDAANSRVQDRQEQLDKEIAQFQKETIKRLQDTSLTEDQRAKIIRDSDKYILDLKKAANIDLLNEEIKALEGSLVLISFSAEEEERIRKTLHELKMKLIDDEYNELQRSQKTNLEKTQEFLEKSQEMYGMYTSSIGNLFASLTDRRLEELDRESTELEERFNRQTELAGDNERVKFDLKEKYEAKAEAIERRKIQAQRRAAIFDKATSATQAGIATALAVTKALPNIPLSVAVGLAGAIQVAAILARPIPQYAEGTGLGGHIGGLAIVGEEGPELMRVPGKGLQLSPSTATVMDLPAGTEVTPYKETMKLLALQGLRYRDSIRAENDKSYMKELNNTLKGIEKTIRNKKETHLNITRAGYSKMVKYAQTRDYFMNQFYK